MILGVVILAIEGYYVYQFYANPSVGSSDSSTATDATVGSGTTSQTQPASPTTVQEQESGAEYVSRIGEIQAGSVEAFLRSDEKLRQPDSLTAVDIEEMEDSLVALNNYIDQTEDLEPPENYTDQHDLFAAAVADLHGATEIAYRLATDPASATQSDYDTYDLLVDRAATGLQRSNEILDEDYETLEQAQGDGR